MRLFIAITLSDELKKSVTSVLHEMKKQGIRGNYVPVQNLHLTLAFIGETRETDAVKEAMQSVRFKPFRLVFSEMGTFGDILWAGMKGKQGLNGLVRDLRKALDDKGISYDSAKFVPHITLVRKVSGKWQNVPAPKGEMTVKKVSLMKSEQKDGKRVYTEIFSVKQDGTGKQEEERKW